jgi:hypothetical protein
MLRSVARALCAEGMLADAEGRHDDAVRSYLDIVRLAPATANGGLIVHDLVGNALAGIGLTQLTDVLPRLGKDELTVVGDELAAIAHSREPVESFHERDAIFDRLAFYWPGRLWAWSDQKMSTAVTYKPYAMQARSRHDAHLRLILTEAAVRRWVLQHGAPPESLESLVPEFLSAVPLDPYGDGPLKYRRTDDRYLLYSVGSNGTDDGGQRATYFEVVVEGKGDYFFDAAQEY